MNNAQLLKIGGIICLIVGIWVTVVGFASDISVAAIGIWNIVIGIILIRMKKK